MGVLLSPVLSCGDGSSLLGHLFMDELSVAFVLILDSRDNTATLCLGVSESWSHVLWVDQFLEDSPVKVQTGRG